MIASLAGIVEQMGAESVVVDVGGVGYLVFAASRTLARLPARGEPVRLLIETHVREDHIHLYGFADDAERDWFRLLTTVQGVGAKTALALLSALAPDALTAAVLAQDKAALTQAAGVGRKLAQRIVIELREKVGSVALARRRATRSPAMRSRRWSIWAIPGPMPSRPSVPPHARSAARLGSMHC
jgi:Holliday junction DNA helicase RuvA